MMKLGCLSTESLAHASAMDKKYRFARFTYDVTRNVFLRGRDRAIEALAPGKRGTILEIGCGTGRNLKRLMKLTGEGTEIYSLDVSAHMLLTAEARVRILEGGHKIRFAQADARDFDPVECFGEKGFDGILMSYSLSMVPDWRVALRHALTCLNPGGRLSIVDFGDYSGLTRTVGRVVVETLGRYQAPPCLTLGYALKEAAIDLGGFRVELSRGTLGMSQFALATRIR